MTHAIRRSGRTGRQIVRTLSAASLQAWVASFFPVHVNLAVADEPPAGRILIARTAATPASSDREVAPSSELSSGMKFQECSDCPAMMVIPAGHFTMTRKPAADGRR